MPDSLGENIYDLLDLIRQRPGMYLGKPPLSALSHFIDGYRDGRAHGNGELQQEEPPFRHFTQWLGRGFRRDGGGASYARILTSEALFIDFDEDRAAFDLFFEFLDEFRRRQSVERAYIEFPSLRSSKFTRTFKYDSVEPKEIFLATNRVSIVEFVAKKGPGVWMRNRYNSFRPTPEFYLSYVYYDQQGDLQTNDDYFSSLTDAMKRGAEEFDFDISEWIVE